MAERTAATAKNGEPSKRRARKPKTEATPVDLNQIENDLRKKYPDRKIIKGSILDSNATKEFGPKRTVEIKCAECDKTRRIATSDLHQVGHCENCTGDIRKKRRREARATTTRPKKTRKTNARATVTKNTRKRTAPTVSEPALAGAGG